MMLKNYRQLKSISCSAIEYAGATLRQVNLQSLHSASSYRHSIISILFEQNDRAIANVSEIKKS